MRFQLTVACLVGVTTAQKACLSLTTNFPSCALSCIIEAGSAIGCTQSDDVGCRCTPASSSAIVTQVLPCILGKCAGSEINPAIAAGATMCACVATAVPDPDPEPTSTATTETAEETTTTAEPNTTLTTVPATTTATDDSVTTTSGSPDTTITSLTTAPPACDTASPCQASADAIPDCGEKCIFSAAVTHAGCATTDFECQCASASIIQNKAQECVIGGCGIPTAIQVLDGVSALCGCVANNPTTPCTDEPTATGSDSSVEASSTETQSSGGGSGTGTSSGEPHTTDKTESGDGGSTTETSCPSPSGECTQEPAEPTDTDCSDDASSPTKSGQHPTCTKGADCKPEEDEEEGGDNCPGKDCGHNDDDGDDNDDDSDDGNEAGNGDDEAGEDEGEDGGEDDEAGEECNGEGCDEGTGSEGSGGGKPEEPEVVVPASSAAKLEIGLAVGLCGVLWAIAEIY